MSEHPNRPRRSASARALLPTLRIPWTGARLPARARAAAAADRVPLAAHDMGPAGAVSGAVAWLARAQDCSRSADGGVARHYSLLTGWANSYPETTGYIIPTLLEAAQACSRPQLMERARRMLDWLVSIQLSGGGFQGGTIDQTPIVPVTFNTGQILIGLAAGARHFDEPRYHGAMHAAARFLRDSQDADGAWRQHRSPFAKSDDKVYETHVSWGLFEAARLAPDHGYQEAGLRQVEWAIGHQLPNGWFEDNCLNDSNAPLTHTIGYTLRGVLEAYRSSGKREFLAAALLTANALGDCLEPDGRLVGRFNRDWQPCVDYACLTGSAQIAICWFMLTEMGQDVRFAELACRANAFVRRTIQLGGDPNTAGGVKGSHPIDGEYGCFQYLNWAAKFAVDANLCELHYLGSDGVRR